MLGSGIVAASFFNFSWQNLVEEAVLGQDIAHQPLNTIELAPEARATFGKATLAFNWNQLNQWNDANASACSKWFLKDAAGQHVQYPMYATALYKQHSDDHGIDLEVQMRGEPMKDAFDVCYRTEDDFCFHTPNISRFEALSSWFTTSSTPRLSTGCSNFKFKSLTLGQVVSASSAAAGGGAVHSWVQSIFELVRQRAKDALQGGTVNLWYCSHYRMIIESVVGMCNQEVVIDEFLRVLGCETSDGTTEVSDSTANRWVKFLQRMAIRMTVDSPLGSFHAGHMAIDAVRPAPRTYVPRHLYINNTTATYIYTLGRFDLPIPRDESLVMLLCAGVQRQQRSRTHSRAVFEKCFWQSTRNAAD
jgi:hypothetical protein